MSKYSIEQLEFIRSFASSRQVEYIDAIIKFGTAKQASKELNVADTTIYRSIDGLIRKLDNSHTENKNMISVMADGFNVKGTSTLIKDGKYVMQWVKTNADDARREELFREVIEGLKDEIPRVTLMQPPPLGIENLLNCYVITDYHLGMLSHTEETGANWDLKIAEEMLVKWFAQAIQQSPDANHCVFAQLSDFLHYDSLDAVTPASKHLLDVDSRFYKLVRTAIRVLRTVIDMLLAKHQTVHIKMLDANHDPVSQIWLREWFKVLYENEPRITVDDSPNPYNAYEFGKVALFFHHGHKRKVSDVSTVFASMYREMFGRTKYAYAHMGHLHSIDVKEDNLMIVEQHRTLAAPDAYAARGGWLSGRDAKVITYHKDFGEVSRLTINSDMLK
jgi:hypothetical protein